MNVKKQSRMMAMISTICAVVWMINCVIDAVAEPAMTGQLTRDVALTLVWLGGAVCWWLRWRRERTEKKPMA